MSVDYDYLSASNGSGDAALMHITTIRLTGATTIKVDTVVNVPTKFIGVAGDLNSKGFIEPSTKQEFKGHVSGGDLIIDAFEPGTTDAGNTIGQVVVIRPTTGFANRVSDFIQSMSGFVSMKTEVAAALKAAVLPLAYPIGSIYISTDSTNPGTTFGFGTWTAFAAGRTLIGVGTSDQAFAAAATGGESNHTLDINEMPSHSHSFNASIGVFNNHNFTGTGWNPFTADVGGFSINNTGGSAAHNNLPPYVVTYMWKRTA